MATEKCSICGELGTPWTSTPELGTGLHMCCTCDAIYSDIEHIFNRYLRDLEDGSYFESEDSIMDILKPRAIKKFTYLLIRRWYNKRMKK